MNSIAVVEEVYRVILDYAYYGITVVNGIVKHAPPIASWSVGKHISEFINLVEIKGGIVEKL